MINQNIDLIGEDNLEYFHLGADEVFVMGKCTKCQFYIEEVGKTCLYSIFVKKLCKKFKKKYPNISIIIWDDMFRNAGF
jgi:hypothetical protein